MEDTKIIDNETFKDMIDTIKRKKRKTKVAPTSVDAYEEYKANEQEVMAEKQPTDCQQIVKFVKENPGCTRDQIAEGTKIKLQTVTGDVSHLVKKGLIEEQGTTLNGSGRKVGKLWSSAAPVTSE